MPDSPLREAHYQLARFGDSKLKPEYHSAEVQAFVNYRLAVVSETSDKTKEKFK